jgi:hypothetical protein
MRVWKIFLLANYAAFLYGAFNTCMTDFTMQYLFPEIDKKELYNPIRIGVQIATSALCFAAHAEYVQWWVALDEFRGEMFSWKLSVRVYFGLLMLYMYMNHLMTESLLIIFREIKSFSGLRLLFLGPNAVLITALCEELGINHTLRRLILTDI